MCTVCGRRLRRESPAETSCTSVVMQQVRQTPPISHGARQPGQVIANIHPPLSPAVTGVASHRCSPDPLRPWRERFLLSHRACILDSLCSQRRLLEPQRAAASARLAGEVHVSSTSKTMPTLRIIADWPLSGPPPTPWKFAFREPRPSTPSASSSTRFTARNV